MGRARWVAVVVAAGAVVGLAGCSPKPAATPTAPASSSSVGLPAPMASPAKPAQWADNGEAGANAAALWFARDAYAYVRETNDATDWQALSTPDCEFCASVTRDATAQAALNQVSRESGFKVTVTRTQELNPLSFAVLVHFDKPETAVLRLDGSVVTTVEGVHGQILLVLHREGPNWLLREGQWFDEGVAVPTAGP